MADFLSYKMSIILFIRFEIVDMTKPSAIETFTVSKVTRVPTLDWKCNGYSRFQASGVRFKRNIENIDFNQGYDKKHFLFPSGEADKIYIQPQQFVLIIIVG